MSPRKHKRREELGRPDPGPTRHDQIEGEFRVRHLSGESSNKIYRCPGCDQEIRPGMPHVVVWPLEDYGDETDRRHWHSSCWNARGRRGPTTLRW